MEGTHYCTLSGYGDDTLVTYCTTVYYHRTTDVPTIVLYSYNYYLLFMGSPTHHIVGFRRFPISHFPFPLMSVRGKSRLLGGETNAPGELG